MSAYRTPGGVSVRQAATKLPATGGITLWHLLEFMSVVGGPSMAIETAKIAGGGPARIGIAIAIGLLFGVPSPLIVHKVGRVAFNAGVPPILMYIAAGLFPLAFGALAAVLTHYVIGRAGLSR